MVISNTVRDEFFRVQIKSRKKVKRSDNKFTDEYVWIEFNNVAGKDGWIYGNYDILAFEREFDFLMVTRKDLLNLCERLIDFNSRVFSSSDALYKIYQRNGRLDKISLIRMKDIEILDKVIWNKNYN